jgi:hypothetical protein
MDNESLNALIKDGEKLAALAAPAFEAQQKVAALEKTAGELRSENERLRVVAQERGEKMKLAASGAADFFAGCGVLKQASRDEFVDRLVDRPEAIFELARDFADKVAGQQFGSAQKDASFMPGSPAAKADGDAVDRFLHGGE